MPNLAISFKPASKNHIITMKLSDYLLLEKPVIADISNPIFNVPQPAPQPSFGLKKTLPFMDLETFDSEAYNLIKAEEDR